MKKVGKIENYDGYYGTIIDDEGNKHLLLKEELIDENIANNDEVSFVPEAYNYEDINESVARFIKKYKYNNDNHERFR